MTTNLQPGDVVGGKYRLEKLLGAGSMGSVWAARNQLTDRSFAIKFMLPSFAQDTVLVQRFLNEARVCGRLDHPSIVEIYDLGTADELEGAPFLVMELLRGEGLDVLLGRVGKMDARGICTIVLEVASALDQAHQRGIVHRDVKPSNIFLHRTRTGDVTPKLLDFGVSKILEGHDANLDITRVGSVLGSPLYMSPEQARGQSDVDPRSDLWSLGVVLYEAVTGVMPFTAANNYNAVLSAILTQRHKPLRDLVPDVPLALSDAVDLCLVKDRNRRMASAAQLATRLEEVLLQLSPRSQREPTPLPPRAAAPPPQPIDFDDSTEIMTRPRLVELFGGPDDDEEAPPLSVTAELRRQWLAELAPSVRTSKTDDISEKIPLGGTDRSIRVQRVESMIHSIEQRHQSSAPPPAAEQAPLPPLPDLSQTNPSFDGLPALHRDPLPSDEVDDDDQAVERLSATSDAIKNARDALLGGGPPPAPPDAPRAAGKTADPGKPAAGATDGKPAMASRGALAALDAQGNKLWLVVIVLLLGLSVMVVVLARK